MVQALDVAFEIAAQALGGRPPSLVRWQRRYGRYLAVASEKTVRVFNRLGKQLSALELPGAVAQLEWTPDGDVAVAVDALKDAVLYWWSSSSGQATMPIATNVRGPLSSVEWNALGDLLALLTSGGSVHVFDRKAARVRAVLPEGSGVTHVVWAGPRILAVADDTGVRLLGVADGQVLSELAVPGRVTLLRIFQDERGPENAVRLSAVLDGTSVYDIAVPADPRNAALPQASHIKFSGARATPLVDLLWLGADELLVFAASGQITRVSALEGHRALEAVETRRDSVLAGVCACEAAGQAVLVFRDGAAALLDLVQLQKPLRAVGVARSAEAVSWSPDGERVSVGRDSGVATVGSDGGALSAACGPWLAWTRGSSVHLARISGGDAAKSSQVLDEGTAPKVLAVGPDGEVFAGWGHRGRFVFRESPPEKGVEFEFPGSVTLAALTGRWLAVLLADGRVALQQCERGAATTLWPTVGQRQAWAAAAGTEETAVRITAVSASSADLLVISTSTGIVATASLRDAPAIVRECAHESPIEAVWAQPGDCGAAVAFRDARRRLYVLGAAADATAVAIGDSDGALSVLWSGSAVGVTDLLATVGAAGSKRIGTHAFYERSLRNRSGGCVPLGTTAIPASWQPALLHGSDIACITAAGELSHVQLALASEAPASEAPARGKQLQRMYMGGLAFKRAEAPREAWGMVYATALQMLDVDTALWIQREKLRDCARALELEAVRDACDNEVALLAGHVALLLDEPDVAREFFEKSSQPRLAVQVARDMRAFRDALALAAQVAPEWRAAILGEFAAEREQAQAFSEAAQLYDEALKTGGGTDADHVRWSHGLARCTLAAGDVTRGLQMLEHVPVNSAGRQLLGECATILERLQQAAHAGTLLERAEEFSRAAELFAAQTPPLLVRIDAIISEHGSMMNPAAWAAVGRALQVGGRLEDAVRALERADDPAALVALLLDSRLDRVAQAMQVARKAAAPAAARRVAQFLQQRHDLRSAIEFCLLARQPAEALELARQTDALALCGELVLAQELRDPAVALPVATFHADAGRGGAAAPFYALGGRLDEAVAALDAADDEDAHNVAESALQTLEIVRDVALRDPNAVSRLRELVLRPGDLSLTFRLQLLLREHAAAFDTALNLAHAALVEGQYRRARDLLLDATVRARQASVRVPKRAFDLFMQLHSYVLAKQLMQAGDHAGAARMLTRVAAHADEAFAAHKVAVLTTAVVECDRAGFGTTAHRIAAALMQNPAMRAAIVPEYARLVERVVRRPSAAPEPDEGASPCPFCGDALKDLSLECGGCSALVPFCVASGRHMTVDGATVCPSCAFPARIGPMRALLEKNGSQCPLCSASVSSAALQLVPDPRGRLLEISNFFVSDRAG